MNVGDQQNNPKGKVKEINLKEYYDVIKKRFWIVLVMTMLTTTAGYLHSIYFKTPTLYQASSRIILQTSMEQINTLLVLFKDPLILESVIEELQLDRSPQEINEQVAVTSINNTQVVKINVVDTNPQRAVEITNTAIETFIREMPKIMGFSNIRVISEAKGTIPIEQDNNRILTAFAVGIILSIGLIFLLDSLDNKVQTKRDIEDYLGVPIIGNISKMNNKNVKTKKSEKIGLEIREGKDSVKQTLEF